MLRFISLLAVCAAMLVITTSSYGAVLASESFSYTASSTLQGNGSAGSGWAGAWGGGLYANDMTIVSGGLSYNAGGVVINGGSTAVQVTDSASSGNSTETRSLASNPTGEVYVRFLLNMGSSTWTNTDTATFQVTGMRSATSRKSFSQVGIDVNNVPDPDAEFSVMTASGKSNEINYNLDQGTTYLVVARLYADPGHSLYAAKYNSIDVWINPNLAGTTGFLGTAVATSDPYLKPGQIDGIQLRQYNADNGDLATFDEYVIGETWGDVVVPEPASIAMLGLGGMALLRRRTR